MAVVEQVLWVIAFGSAAAMIGFDFFGTFGAHLMIVLTAIPLALVLLALGEWSP